MGGEKGNVPTDARRDQRPVCSQVITFSTTTTTILVFAESILHLVTASKTAPFTLRNHNIVREVDAEGLVERVVQPEVVCRDGRACQAPRRLAT